MNPSFLPPLASSISFYPFLNYSNKSSFPLRFTPLLPSFLSICARPLAFSLFQLVPPVDTLCLLSSRVLILVMFHLIASEKSIQESESQK